MDIESKKALIFHAITLLEEVQTEFGDTLGSMRRLSNNLKRQLDDGHPGLEQKTRDATVNMGKVMASTMKEVGLTPAVVAIVDAAASILEAHHRISGEKLSELYGKMNESDDVIPFPPLPSEDDGGPLVN